ncbi:MAG: hypothetical protein F4Y41_00680 [Gammaproteobacteria bacterium]|nr:hypothetical protein [Gammaproteobacteria bacterium]MYF30932.1 hypothetical protein [Gammaproteobacteria bacterium]
MEEQDPVPTPRMHWTRLVLGRGHPIIIIGVLAAVGAAICWFSLQRISLLTQTPTRYEMELEVATEGCDDRRLAVFGDIGSFGASYFEFRFFDDDDRPLFVEGCRVRSILLRSNLDLQPARSWDGSLTLVRVTGMDPDLHMDQANGEAGPSLPLNRAETFGASIVGSDLSVISGGDSTGSGLSFLRSVDEDIRRRDTGRAHIRYEVAFHEKWQPILLTWSFEIPENVRTYVSLRGHQRSPRLPVGQDGPADGGRPAMTYDDLDMSVSFRTDEVLLVRGLMSDSGDAVSVYGYLRFGLENSDAESKRESGNVRFSAILGIGIALIVEAFVILLALGVRALAARLGVAGKAVPAD